MNLGPIILAILIIAPPCFGEAIGPFDEGYLYDVEVEVPTFAQEFIVVENPDEGPSFHDKVFNHTLSQEFLFQYQQRFGRTEQLGNYFLINRQGYFFTPSGVSKREEDQQRREFAEYMLRRLAEYHAENIMKNDPKLRAIYEAKQAISNVKVEVGPQSKIDMNYSFVGNFANFRLVNPWAPFQMHITMDPGSLTPTAPNEVDYAVNRGISKTVRFEVGFKQISRLARLVFFKTLSAQTTITLTYQEPLGRGLLVTDDEIDNEEFEKEGLALLGLTTYF